MQFNFTNTIYELVINRIKGVKIKTNIAIEMERFRGTTTTSPTQNWKNISENNIITVKHSGIKSHNFWILRIDFFIQMMSPEA